MGNRPAEAKQAVLEGRFVGWCREVLVMKAAPPATLDEGADHDAELKTLSIADETLVILTYGRGE